MNTAHVPVLLQESIEVLHLEPGETVIDCTLGLAGHAKQFCNAVGKKGTLIAFDADIDNIVLAKKVLQDVSADVHVHHTNFIDLPKHTPNCKAKVFADLGVSSLHFDLPERGFSHRFDGPLDMRLDRTTGYTCVELLRSLSENALERILVEYGELHRPKALVRQLFLHAQEIQTTFDVKRIIDDVYTYKAKQYYGQVFQALRIATNNELSALEFLVRHAIEARYTTIAIITFHSLEDRIVKHAFRAASTDTKDNLTGMPLHDAPYTLVTKKPIIPTEAEVALNPRSRSAKLRAITLRI